MGGPELSWDAQAERRGPATETKTGVQVNRQQPESAQQRKGRVSVCAESRDIRRQEGIVGYGETPWVGSQL